ncbi:alpha/beta hydrolase [Rhodococcus ruber]|uniref:Alpha/beta hydrolase n=1 Tax=Rhodococcus ruber TaxID=1830 RepID=A0ABT4MLA6_9NOCA|nr:alpha/beta hydrolase [Rhodococcus ruber]MCZ4521766.1 alpha/beta hydrolase [Rhodococcus ruber]
MTDVRTISDIEYASADGTTLTLDLHIPAGSEQAPVVLYFHGGGWQVGDKAADTQNRLIPLAERGVVVASVQYRFASQSLYPAQVHDAKAAVRWVRANGANFDLHVDRLGVWGASAGGYVASMLALTSGDAELEGTVGAHGDQDSSVQAAVAWFAPSDLTMSSRRSPLESQLVPPPPEPPLFGIDKVEDELDRVRRASPAWRAHAAAPPFLLAHGDHDLLVAERESHTLHDALTRAGASSTLVTLGGAGHEGPEFDSAAHLALTAAFMQAHLTSDRTTD